jgi:predicted acetyltransferase
MLRLVKPSVKYKKSFLDDYLTHDEMQESYEMAGMPKTDVPKHFNEFAKRLRGQAEGKYLKLGYIPQSVYWLVDGKKFLGKTDIRHYLNAHLKKIGGHIGYYISPSERQKGYGKAILKLALRKAKALGIKNALITCDITNFGSKRIIEANGGKFVSAVRMGKGLPKKLRYNIKL